MRRWWVLAAALGWTVGGLFLNLTVRGLGISFAPLVFSSLPTPNGRLVRGVPAGAPFTIVVGEQLGSGLGTGPALFVALALAGAVAGQILAATQWLILRRHIRHAEWWVLASVPGWLVGWPLALLGGATATGAVVATVTGHGSGAVGAPVAVAVIATIVSTVGGAVGTLYLPPTGGAASLVLGAALVGASSGAAIGATQWLMLRHQVQHAGRWILASVLGWLVSWSLAVTLAIPGVVPGPSVTAAGSAGGAPRPLFQFDFPIGPPLGAAAYGLITGTVLAHLVRSPRPGARPLLRPS